MKAKGIRYEKEAGKWRAVLHYGGAKLNFGLYDTFEDAVRGKRKKADLYRLDLSDERLFGCPMSELLGENPP